MIRKSAILVLMALALAACSLLQAKDSGCTLADFKGSYGFEVSGKIQPGLSISGDFGRLGKIVGNGLGTATGTTTANYHGTYQTDLLTGPYTVSPSCYFTWTVYLTSIATYASFEGTLTGTGQIPVIVANPPGDALTGFFEKQKEAGCTAKTLSGTYALTMTGFVEDGKSYSGPFGRGGQIVFDGSKTATATSTVSYNGSISAETLSGSYTVSDDCHLTFQTNLPAPANYATTIEGTISADSSHVLLMVTSPAGVVIMGEMEKQ